MKAVFNTHIDKPSGGADIWNTIFNPILYRPDHTANIVHNNILDIFKQYSSDNVVLIHDNWCFRYIDEIEKFLQDNSTKHVIILSGFDPPQLLSHVNALESHPAGYTQVGNTADNEFYFSYWLEFARFYLPRYTVNLQQPDIHKLFLSLNKKPHDHRIKLVKALYNANLQDFGYLTLGNVGNADCNSTDAMGLPLPLTLSEDLFDENNQNEIPNNFDSYIFLGNDKYWKESFVNIVTETRVGNHPFFSEKILKPILSYKPFIVIGPNSLHSWYSEWGIDTFEDILGIDYSSVNNLNQTENLDEYYKKIVDVLNNLKNENLNLLYSSLKPRLIENRKALINQMDKNHKYIQSIASKF